MKQKTLLDEENRLELLSQLGDPLEILLYVEKLQKNMKKSLEVLFLKLFLL